MAENFEQGNQSFVQPVGEMRNENNLPGEQVWSPAQAGSWGSGGQALPDGVMGDAMQSIRRQIENQIGQAIDHYAGQVPGGHQFSPQAKQAVSHVLDGLERQLADQAANRLGGLGGGIATDHSQGSQDNGQSPL